MNILAEVFFPVVISFILAYLIGKSMIPILHKMKYGQSIREEGPKSHMTKQGTPTMGGLIFIFSTTIVTVLYSVLYAKTFNNKAIMVLLIFIAFGFVGFLDDYLKIKRKKNLGLTANQKMILLTIITIGIYFFTRKFIGTVVYIPIFDIKIDIGFLYLPFLFVYFVGVTNAVNLTDGLDGLATSVTIVVLIFLFISAFIIGHIDLGFFAFILIGSLMGFLIFNVNPAKVFMGDTGSLALGGAIAALALFLRIEIILILAGIVYVIEALSVIIQVVVFKITKKRVFKMAPIHHHFEYLGWSENKIVYVFTGITLVGCIISFLIL